MLSSETRLRGRGRTSPFYQVDVFTDQAYRGNPLAVISLLRCPEQEVPDKATMQRLANWTNLSETTFLLPPTDPDKADYRVRIFTPQAELPFAGHPTLGTCKVWLSEMGLENDDGDEDDAADFGDGDHQARKGKRQGLEIVQECGIGLVRISKKYDPLKGFSLLSFLAPDFLRTGEVGSDLIADVCKATGLVQGRDVVDSMWIDNGPGWFGLELNDSKTVLDLKISDPALLSGYKFGVIGKVERKEATSSGEQDDGPDYEVRAFYDDGGGMMEDPVTGSLK
ncbi:Diaminopimelate epimerase-like protein [Violaceomyces palustris]|uniref:Diaminopimelate epimerase-like protein n=1 Tax=Violaceomyces palustris TaxID=1673888 RepID=A0ACD0NWD9_9BASI|nr:Diaminopimelate epimerase-like protein [Violaceomyces palustris]